MFTQIGLWFLLTSSTYNLPPDLLSAICYTESKYNTHAVHLDDGGEPSLGICQIHYSTAKWLGFKGTPTQLMDPKTNIEYAGRYLAKQLERYDENAQKAVIAYNYGHAPKNLTYTRYQIKVFTRWGTKNVQKWSTSQMH
jgi:soluble lytic murein transglycosylase-like protein